jgi:8-oxo-dGTP pyrophosphatase MutT (NUDIX family)
VTVDRAEIVRVVEAYRGRYPEDAERLAPFLESIAGGGDLISRKTVPGHVTCSAYVLNGAGEVLHVRHNTLRRWLQPGGHIEPADTDLADGARREVAEETGIPAGALTLLAGDPVDVEAHRIPANPAKGEAAHWHFDVRYAFAVDGVVATTPQLDEVSGIRWLAMDDPEAVTATRDVAARLKALR